MQIISVWIIASLLYRARAPNIQANHSLGLYMNTVLSAAMSVLCKRQHFRSMHDKSRAQQLLHYDACGLSRSSGHHATSLCVMWHICIRSSPFYTFIAAIFPARSCRMSLLWFLFAAHKPFDWARYNHPEEQQKKKRKCSVFVSQFRSRVFYKKTRYVRASTVIMPISLLDSIVPRVLHTWASPKLW